MAHGLVEEDQKVEEDQEVEDQHPGWMLSYAGRKSNNYPQPLEEKEHMP